MSRQTLAPWLIALALLAGCGRADRAVAHDVTPPAAVAQAPAAPVVPTTAELESQFEADRLRILTLTERLERDYQVRTNQSWMLRTWKNWFPWPKKPRQEIRELIQQIADAADHQMLIARRINKKDLYLAAEAERELAAELISTLDEYNYRNHNKYDR